MFEKRNRRVRPFCADGLNAGAEGFPSLERWRRCLQRSIELLHCAQGLAELIPKLDGHISKCFEDMVLVARLGLRAGQCSPSLAVNCFEGQKVWRANLCDRTVEDGGAPRPLAEFPRDRRSEFCVGWVAHQAEGMLNLLVRDDAEEG